MSLSKAADDLRRAGFDLPKRFRQLIEGNRGNPKGIPGEAWRKDKGRVNASYLYNPAKLAPWLESRGVQRSCK